MRFPPCAVAISALLLGPAATPAGAAMYDISTTSSNMYMPKELRVAAGDVVRWAASGTHPLVFDADPMTSFTTPETRTLNTPGVISYYCEAHVSSGMTGTVTVNGSPAIGIVRETAAPRAGEPVSFRATTSDPNSDPVRIDWDLDGDGTYERTNAGATASASYAAGSHTVNARATDDFPSSSTASHAFTVPGAGGGTPGGGSGPGSSDSVAPNLDARAPKSIRARKLRKRGVKLTLTPSEDGRLVAELRNRRGRKLGRATAQAYAGQATVLRVRAKNAKAGSSLKLRIVAIDLAGNRKKLTRGLAVR